MKNAFLKNIFFIAIIGLLFSCNSSSNSEVNIKTFAFMIFESFPTKMDLFTELIAKASWAYKGAIN